MKFLKPLAFTTLTLGAAQLALADSIPFTGVAFNRPTGGATTFLHRDDGGGSGTSYWKLNGEPTISYTWNESTVGDLSTGEGLFENANMSLLFDSINGASFDVRLDIGGSQSGGGAPTDKLTVGGTTSPSTQAIPGGSATLTNSIGGQFGFELRAADTNKLIADGTFFFDSNLNMGPFNKVGRIDPGNALDVAAFLWGSSKNSSGDSLVYCTSGPTCASSSRVWEVKDNLLNGKALAMDLSFTGSGSPPPPGTAPEPRTLALLAIGLIGLSTRLGTRPGTRPGRPRRSERLAG